MNIEVFIGCIILATGIFLRFWGFDKQCEFRATAEVLQEDCGKTFDPKWIMTYWYYERMSMLGKAVTHAGLAVIASYHSALLIHPTTIVITLLASIIMMTFWIFLYREHARCAKVFKGVFHIKVPKWVLFLVKFQKLV